MLKERLEDMNKKDIENSGCTMENMESLQEEICSLNERISLFKNLPYILCCQVAKINILSSVDTIDTKCKDSELTNILLSMVKSYSFGRLNLFPGSIASFNSNVATIIDEVIDALFQNDFTVTDSLERRIDVIVERDFFAGSYDDIMSYIISEEEAGMHIDFSDILIANKEERSIDNIVINTEKYLREKENELALFKKDLIILCKKLTTIQEEECILENNNNDVEAKTSELYEKLLHYGYCKDDFAIKELECFRDNTNDGFGIIEIVLAAIPKKFEKNSYKITLNFTYDNIQLYDKDGNVLLTTVGEGYDDIVKPLFLVI